MDYREVISINPNVRFGKPCITGTRMSVYDVLGRQASGMSIAEITVDFPEITSKHLQACLQYAADIERKVKYAIGSCGLMRIFLSGS